MKSNPKEMYLELCRKLSFLFFSLVKFIGKYLFEKSRLRSFHKEILHAVDPTHYIGRFSKEILHAEDPNEFIRGLAVLNQQRHRLKMVKRRTWVLSIVGLIVTSFTALLTFNEPVRKIVVEKSIMVLSIARPAEKPILVRVVHIPKLVPDSLDFCGEQVPLSDHKIYKKMRTAIIQNRYTRSAVIKRKAAYWFPIITPILEKYHIPEDFKYIPLVETEFINAVSPRGAAGFWQFMPSTARDYGLIVNGNVDQRLDVVLETRAACKYLHDLHRTTRSWTLTAAAYNMGLPNLQHNVSSQKSRNYYSLALNKETSKYIYTTVAVKHLISRKKSVAELKAALNKSQTLTQANTQNSKQKSIQGHSRATIPNNVQSGNQDGLQAPDFRKLVATSGA